MTVCKECHKEDQKTRREMDPERARELDRRKYAKNPEAHKARSRRYVEQNAETIARKKKEWTQSNSQRVKESQKRWYEKNREKVVRAVVIAQNIRRSNGEGHFSLEEWESLCEFYEHTCLRCGDKGSVTIDHVIPSSKGGTSWISNIQPLCINCNSQKNDRTEDYRDRHLHSAFLDALVMEGM